MVQNHTKATWSLTFQIHAVWWWSHYMTHYIRGLLMIFCSTYSTDILRVWLGNTCKSIVGAVRPSSNVGYYYSGELNKKKETKARFIGLVNWPVHYSHWVSWEYQSQWDAFVPPNDDLQWGKASLVNIAGENIHMVEQGEFCYPLAFCKSLKYQCWPLDILQNAFFECISKEYIMKQSKMIFLVLWIPGMQKET